MKTLGTLIKRNIKLFFKDKGLFFTSLITPFILLILYSTFLGKVYRDSFTSNLPDGFNLSDKVINGIVGGELFSSLLAVSCVTVAFCSNMLMVQDKITNAIDDFHVTPVKASTLAVSYYIATFVSTLIVCLAAFIGSLIYVAAIGGWCFSALDIILIILDIIILVMFGTALSSIINYFLTSQGQVSAVGTIVSSCYGFICGAYMPISSFNVGLQKVIMFLPGTYGTSLLRNHALNGSFKLMEKEGVPTEIITPIKKSIDCNLDFFGHNVSMLALYLVIGLTVVGLLAIYILVNKFVKRNK